MGVDYLYCSNCDECFHSDCFEHCGDCGENISIGFDENLCDNCDGDYVIDSVKWGRNVRLCKDCNPKFKKKKRKNAGRPGTKRKTTS